MHILICDFWLFSRFGRFWEKNSSALFNFIHVIIRPGKTGLDLKNATEVYKIENRLCVQIK